MQQSQFSLLRQRRFAPYFFTQLLGAFNDNVFKNALVALIAFSAAAGAPEQSGLLVNLSAGLFILPFFLFSALAGQIADKYEKSILIRRIKLAEIVIMLLATVAFFLQSIPLLIAILFLMGMQSAFFGPIKYGILPQHLDEQELVGGNGLVEMGTFLSILIGTIVGTQLGSMPSGSATWLISGCILVIAVAGYVLSLQIPSATPSAPDLKIDFNPIRETIRLVGYTRKHRVIFQSILGISWFWGLGAIYLAQFTLFARDVMGGNANTYTALLALFSVGIAIGSILCERLSHNKVEIGLVPFGAFGITIFGLVLWASAPDQPLGSNLGPFEYLSAGGSLWVYISVLMIGIFGGFYIVPLYALVQQLSKPDKLSRAIACNNILNALMMVSAALLGIALLAMNISVPGIFLIAALLNLGIAIYIFTLVPEFMMRFLTWLVIHTIYRVKTDGLEKIPEEGAVILAVNHVSFMDPMIVGGSVRRPVRFVMYYKIYLIPVMNFVFRTARAIPIAGRKEDEAMYNRAFEEMEQAVRDGDVLCIFPEGQITYDGELNEFKPGIDKLLASEPAPVMPVALRGLWGSFFSRKGGPALRKLPRKLFARIDLVFDDPIPADKVTAKVLQDRVLEMRGDKK